MTLLPLSISLSCDSSSFPTYPSFFLLPAYLPWRFGTLWSAFCRIPTGPGPHRALQKDIFLHFPSATPERLFREDFFYVQGLLAWLRSFFPFLIFTPHLPNLYLRSDRPPSFNSKTAPLPVLPFAFSMIPKP